MRANGRKSINIAELIGNLDNKISHMDNRISELRQDMKADREAMEARIAADRKETAERLEADRKNAEERLATDRRDSESRLEAMYVKLEQERMEAQRNYNAQRNWYIANFLTLAIGLGGIMAVLLIGLRTINGS